ncbi:hypothetical protein B0F90DRAFT_1785393 [Multifurca ochricompacta]|uniref:Uncharacterized protein n=1 Tax=Multifurca ochricompacta TaxID=376703 RepID=A0AAD4LV06_9AGAM|nr:hypothetical protein B0F90DRAFT_1785393 [Multifurca ochricompacta]
MKKGEALLLHLSSNIVILVCSVFGVLLPASSCWLVTLDGVLEPILTFSLGYAVLFILSKLSSFKCCSVKHLTPVVYVPFSLICISINIIIDLFF